MTKMCGICWHEMPGHKPNCPVLTGVPVGGLSQMQQVDKNLEKIYADIINRRDAEIARLTQANKAITFQYLEARSLIIELAEAVQYCHVYRINDATIAEHRELMQRTREAIK
jgi:hypothetical protein